VIPIFEIKRRHGIRCLFYANGGARYIYPGDADQGPINDWLWPVLDHWPVGNQLIVAYETLCLAAKAMKGPVASS
jgi:hypothetical protein